MKSPELWSVFLLGFYDRFFSYNYIRNVNYKGQFWAHDNYTSTTWRHDTTFICRFILVSFLRISDRSGCACFCRKTEHNSWYLEKLCQPQLNLSFKVLRWVWKHGWSRDLLPDAHLPWETLSKRAFISRSEVQTLQVFIDRQVSCDLPITPSVNMRLTFRPHRKRRFIFSSHTWAFSTSR